MKGDFSRWTFEPGKHYHGVLKQQGRVDLDADWNEQGAIASHRVETETVDVIGQSGAPVGNAGFQVTPAPGGKGLAISAGRAYVDGILCENEQAALSITAQPDYPGFPLPTAPGVYVAYLKVWLRHITALDDAHIREDALGGPDTCSRSRTVWQVGLLQPKVTGNITCATSLPEWDALIAPSTGTLTARAQPDPTATDPCMIPAKAGYRSLENQLYRVEIHAGGSGGQATYKWSRDNGSVVTSWLSQTAGDLAVSSTGRDAELGFAGGQWVELTDDTHELNFLPGTLAQITKVENNVISINTASATGPITFASFPINPRIRRWDSAGALPATAGSWLNLEDGVQVEFSSGSYTTGDYWMIPARTLTADVDWPQDASNNPLAQAPKGIDRHFCKLAILTFNGGVWTVMSTCLPMFPPLTTLNAGDRETGIHITAVRFLRDNLNFLNDSDVPLALLNEGIGIVCDAPVAPHSIKRPTCFVTVDLPLLAADANLAGDVATQAAGATLSLSSTPAATATPSAPAATATPSTPAAKQPVATVAANQPLAMLAVNLPAAPLAVNTPPAATLPVNPPATGGLPINTNPGATAAVAQVIGFHPMILNAATSLSTDNLTVQWNVGSTAILAYLQAILARLQAAGQDPRLLAHLTLKGNFIWGPNDRLAQTYLDGEAYGIPRLDDPNDATSIRTSLKLPKSGNGERGGDFEMWFWLTMPVTLASLTFTPNTVVSVGASVGTLTLTAAAPQGGAVVTLTASDAKLATIPATVTIPAGQLSATFQVTGASSPVAVSVLQVTGTYLQSTATGTLTIHIAPPK